MEDVTNIAELGKRILALKDENPSFKYDRQMPADQENYYIDFALHLSRMLHKFSDKGVQISGETGKKVNRLLNSIELAVRTNDQHRLGWAISQMVEDFEVIRYDQHGDPLGTCSDCKPEQQTLPDGTVVDHDAGCWGLTVNMWLWTTLMCFTRIACFVKHLAADAGTDSLFTGHCDNQGTEECKCVQAKWRLSTAILMLGVILFLVGGPVGGASGTALARAAILRLAPAVP